MADFIALDWETRGLNGFEAQVSKGKVRLRLAFTLEWPTDQKLAEGTKAGSGPERKLDAAERARLKGQWLKEQLRGLGVSAKQTLISLPREESVVRQLEVPNVPEGDMPDIVRLQAETKMSSSLDKQLLDFMPMPKRPDAETRDVLMATVGIDFVDRIRKTLDAAGLEPVSLGLSSAATAEILIRTEQARGLSPDDTSLVVASHGTRLELALVRQNSLIFSHAAQLSGDSEEAVIQSCLAEVSRSMISIGRVLGGGKLARAWILGTVADSRRLCDALRNRLSCEIQVLEPLTELALTLDTPSPIANSAGFAGPLGMLLAASGQTCAALDFLNPRKAIVRLDKKTLRIRAAAIAAAVLFVFGMGGNWWYQSDLQAQIDERKSEFSTLDGTVNRGLPTSDSATIINDWDARSIRPLDQVAALNKAFPGTDRMYIREFHFLSGQQRDDFGRIEATGYAKDRSDVESLKQQLADMKYLVKPTTEKRSTRDPKYPFEFKLDLHFVKTDNAKVLPPAPAR